MEKIDWNTKENKQLVEGILSLKTADETRRFLRDLMTEGEILEFAKRMEAARMLSRNFQYNAIIEKTGLSSTTVARVSKWLRGSLGGYRLVLNNLNPAQIVIRSGKHHIPLKLEKGLS